MSTENRILPSPLRWLWLVLLVLHCGASPVGAQQRDHLASDDPLAAGARAYRAGDFDLAVAHWRPLAEAGDRDAQFALGTLYQAGQGVTPSEQQATTWFRRAAEQGSAPAQFNLGNAYKHGRGVTVDEARAVYWWRQAAAAGLPPAQFNLGTAYLYGRGVAQSRPRAEAWYRKAAANGHPGAHAALQRLASAAESTPVHGTEWVRSRSSRSFTVQLLAAETEAQALEYVATLPAGEYAVCPYRSQDRRWFAVLAGDYPDAAAARAAAARWSLPNPPWVRQFGSLQSRLDP